MRNLMNALRSRRGRPAAARPTVARAARCEPLEGRRLFSYTGTLFDYGTYYTVQFDGDNASDTFVVAAFGSGGQVRATLNGSTFYTTPSGKPTLGVIVNASGGNDVVTVSAPVTAGVTGGDGADQIATGSGNDTIFGQNGDDVINGGTGTDSLDGGAGTDRLDFTYLAAPNYVNADLGAGTAKVYNGSSVLVENEAIAGFEQLQGGGGNDELRGNAGPNSLAGNGGNDNLLGGDGFDYLYGGDGNDLLYPGGQGDYSDGGNGTDTVEYTHYAAGWRAVVNLGADVARVYDASNVEQEYETLISIENARGGSGNDIFEGGSEANTFWGGDGNDSFNGMGGADTLYGENGNDTFVSNDGVVDSIFGGAGTDTATTRDASDILNSVEVT